MRTKVLGLILSSALGLGLVGCGGGGGNPLSLLQQCGTSALVQVVSIGERLSDVLTVMRGGTVNRVAVTPGAAANSFDFTIALDEDANGVNDTTITGTWTFSADPLDGIDADDTATLVVTQTGGGVSPNATATLAMTFLTERQFETTGTAEVTDVLGCTVNLTFPAIDPLTLTFDDFPVVEPQLAIRIADLFDIFGSAQINVALGSDTLDSTIVIDDAAEIAALTLQVFNLREIGNDPLPFNFVGASYADVQSCSVIQIFGSFGIGGLLESVLEGLRDDTNMLDDEGGTFTATRISGNTFDITATTDSSGIRADITARVNFSADPEVGTFAGTALVTSYRIEIRRSVVSGEFGDAIPEFNSVNVRTVRIEYVDDEGDPTLDRVSGTSRTTSIDGRCVGTATSSNFGILDGSGRVTVDATLDGSPFRFTLVDREEELDGADLVRANFGGVLVPGNLLTTLFDSFELLDDDDDE